MKPVNASFGGHSLFRILTHRLLAFALASVTVPELGAGEKWANPSASRASRPSSLQSTPVAIGPTNPQGTHADGAAFTAAAPLPFTPRRSARGDANAGGLIHSVEWTP